MRNNLFFIFRVSAQRDDFHAIQQCRRDGIAHVGRENEHHFGKIKGQIQIMVAERAVLLRIQGFQQGRGGIAPKICPEFIDLVHHENGVVGTALPQALEDSAGQGPDIGPAMPADLRFIPDTPQGNPNEFSFKRPGNGLSQGCLAHPRRAHKTKNRPFHFGIQFQDAQVFQDAVLDFIQPVMIGIQYFFCRFNINDILCGFAPGQLHQPVQVGPDHGRFSRVRVHLFQAPELLQGFLFSPL